MSYHNNINPFENYSGSMNLSKPGYLLLFLLFYCWVTCCETYYWDYFSIRTTYLVVFLYLFCYPIMVLYRHRFKFHATWHRKIHKRVAFRVWYRRHTCFDLHCFVHE
jgi:hypothetical protein